MLLAVKISVSLFYHTLEQIVAGAYLISSKTVVQFNDSDVIPARPCLRKHLVREAARHPIANRVHGAASRERFRIVRREPCRDQLYRLVLEIVGVYKGLVRDYTACSTILYTKTIGFE